MLQLPVGDGFKEVVSQGSWNNVSACKVKVRSKKVSKLKWMSVVQNMFCVSFGMQNLMVTSIFKFDLEKGQCQVRLGQI